MIDGAALALEVTAIMRILQVADVEDVRGGQALRHGTDFGVALVELVIQEEVFLPLLIVHYALVDVLCAGERGDGDDVSEIALLVRHFVDGQCVFVVAVADVAPVVPLVWAAVDEALCVVDVAVAGGAARGEGMSGVGHVEEDEAAAAGQVATDADGFVAADGADSHGVVELLVDDDVVRAADGQLVPVSGEILLGEVVWASRIEGE